MTTDNTHLSKSLHKASVQITICSVQLCYANYNFVTLLFIFVLLTNKQIKYVKNITNIVMLCNSILIRFISFQYYSSYTRVPGKEIEH